MADGSFEEAEEDFLDNGLSILARIIARQIYEKRQITREPRLLDQVVEK